MGPFSALIRQYAEAYAEHWGIPAGDVRRVLDGPDRRSRFRLRLDSYEHPSCETETLVLTEDGAVTKEEYEG